MLVIAGTLISLARTPMHVWNTLWAEDGPIFVGQALASGPRVIVEGYAGYMHLIARLGAEVAVLFPLDSIPTAVTIISAFATSLIGSACFVMIETKIRSLALRLAVWIVCIALPIMGGEVANNLANMHWYLLIAAFIATTVRANSTSVAVIQSVVLFVAVTSDALCLMLLPLLAVRWWLLTSKRDRAPAVAFAAGAVIQIAVVISQILFAGGRPIAAARPSGTEFVDFYTFRVVLGGLFGTSQSSALLDAGGVVLPGVVLVGVVIVLVLASRADATRRGAVLAFTGGSVGFALVVFTVQWDGLSRAPLSEVFTGGRYVVVPTALLLIGLIVAAEAGIARIRRPWAGRLVAILVLAAVVMPTAVDFRPMNIRAEASAWTAEVDRADAECETLPDTASVSLGIAPSWFGGVAVTCAVIEAH
jgi:hypothetical protein